MELLDAIRTMGTTRFYKPDAVPDEVLARALDAARFAPTGGNRQPVRFVVVRDPAVKRRFQEMYLVHWDVYVARIRAGQSQMGATPTLIDNADHFARHLAEIPVHLVCCAALGDVYPTDHQLGRLSVVGGASIYPAIQNLLLACRAEGLGATLTTLLCANEVEVRGMLGLPADISTVAYVPVGWPARPFPKSLMRRPLEEMVHAERWGGAFPAER